MSLNAELGGIELLDRVKGREESYDGRVISFEPGETKIVAAEVANFLEKRFEVTHKRDEKGNFIGIPEGKKVFKLVPLSEALKVAKLEENPSLVAARRKQEEDVRQLQRMAEEVKRQLLAEGWKPPKENQKASNKEDA